MQIACFRNFLPLAFVAATAMASQPAPTGQPSERAPDKAPAPGPRDDAGPRDERPPRRMGERMGEKTDPPLLRESIARDPKSLREAIERMLEQNSRIEKRLTEAKARLDAGDPPEEVFRGLREARAGNMADQFFQNWRDRQRENPTPEGPMFERPRFGPGGPDSAQREELLAFVREVRPEFAARLEAWQKDEPKAFRTVVGFLIMQSIDTFRERERDPQLFALRKEDLRASILIVEKSTELRAMQNAGKAESDNPQFAAAKAELRELMGKGYDARVRVREFEADRLAKRLDETRARIQETKEVREQMLDKAVQQLLERKRVSPQPGDEPPLPPRRPEGKVPDKGPEKGPDRGPSKDNR